MFFKRTTKKKGRQKELVEMVLDAHEKINMLSLELDQEKAERAAMESAIRITSAETAMASSDIAFLYEIKADDELTRERFSRIRRRLWKLEEGQEG